MKISTLALAMTTLTTPLFLIGCGSSDVSRSIVVASDTKAGDVGLPPESTLASASVVEMLASDAIISGDITLNGNELQQNTTNMDPETSGLARFTFLIRDAGAYTVSADVTAENGNSNSFFLDIGNNPRAEHVWHIISKPGAQKVAYGRGGTIADPKPAHEFVLSQGIHTLYLRGREAGAKLRSLHIEKVPSP